MNDWLNIVAKQHKHWIIVVNSFGEYDYAEDIVQEMYIALYKYTTPEKIIKDGKVSNGYIFFTLRSLYYQFYNAKNKITKVSLDDIQLEHFSNIDEQEAYYKFCETLDQYIDSWHWYDKRLFRLYRDTDMSIRKLAKETGISWVSIFNTLKKCKIDLKENFSEHYDNYINGDYERI